MFENDQIAPPYIIITWLFKKSLSESENTEDIISDCIFLATNDKFKNKPTNRKHSYFIIYERPSIRSTSNWYSC